MEDNEKRFEQDIETWLTSSDGGWEKEVFQNTNYDASKGLDLDALIAFIQKTQPKQWKRYEKIIGKAPEGSFYKRFEQEVSQHGILHVLRKGVQDRGVKFKVIQFKPSSSLNDEVQAHMMPIKQRLLVSSPIVPIIIIRLTWCFLLMVFPW